MRYFVLTVVSVFVLTSCDKPDFRDLPMSDMDHTGEPRRITLNNLSMGLRG